MKPHLHVTRLAAVLACAALIGSTGAIAGTAHKHHRKQRASPHIYAGCQKEDCMGDPAAWAALMGSRAEDHAAQHTTMRAARAVVATQKVETGNSLLLDMPSRAKEELMGTLEDVLTQAGTAPAHVLVARARVRGGGGFLFCGSALYGNDGGGGLFIVDTSPGGVVLTDSGRDAYMNAGCDLPAVTMR